MAIVFKSFLQKLKVVLTGLVGRVFTTNAFVLFKATALQPFPLSSIEFKVKMVFPELASVAAGITKLAFPAFTESVTFWFELTLASDRV